MHFKMHLKCILKMQLKKCIFFSKGKTYKIHLFFILLHFLEVEVVYGNPLESFIKMLLQLFQELMIFLDKS